MKVFDIDGTLTLPFGEIEDKTGFHSYAYWDLLTDCFVKSKEKFRAEIAAWNESMKTEEDPTSSSHLMMQRAVLEFADGITGQHLREKAKQMTHVLINHGIVRLEAITYLKYCLDNGELCVLSTGSYTEGAYGFVDALIEKGLLPAGVLEARLKISGAVVDWSKRELKHANVRERKILGLRMCLGTDDLPVITGVYCDDPEINDKGIFDAAAPECRFVIHTEKRCTRLTELNIALCEWADIIAPIPALAFALATTGTKKSESEDAVTATSEAKL